MNTNPQTHIDFIWSFEAEKGGIARAVVLAGVVALIVLVVWARKRKKA